MRNSCYTRVGILPSCICFFHWSLPLVAPHISRKRASKSHGSLFLWFSCSHQPRPFFKKHNQLQVPGPCRYCKPEENCDQMSVRTENLTAIASFDGLAQSEPTCQPPTFNLAIWFVQHRFKKLLQIAVVFCGSKLPLLMLVLI